MYKAFPQAYSQVLFVRSSARIHTVAKQTLLFSDVNIIS